MPAIEVPSIAVTTLRQPRLHSAAISVAAPGFGEEESGRMSDIFNALSKKQAHGSRSCNSCSSDLKVLVSLRSRNAHSGGHGAVHFNRKPALQGKAARNHCHGRLLA